MEPIAVTSSAIKAVAYDRHSLVITFESGHMYRYFGVPRQIFSELLDAPSKGRYFHEHILGQYRFHRLR